MSAPTLDSIRPSDLVPLVSVAGILHQIAPNSPNVPNYSRLKSDGYSGRFAIEKVGGKLTVRSDTLREMVRLYGLQGSDQAAA